MTRSVPAGESAAAAPDAVAVRAATAEDAAALADIYAHWVATSTATFDLVAPDALAWAEKLAGVRAAGWPFLVAVDGPVDGPVGGPEAAGVAVLGLAYVAPWRPRPAYRWTVEDTIYLHPDAVGRGVGRLLLDAVVRAAAEAGAREVIAVVADADTPASLALHRRAGFVEVGRLERVGHKFDRWLGTTLLQRSLVDAP